MHLSLLEVVRIQKHCQILWSCRMSSSWPRRVKMDSFFSTNCFWQVLRHWHQRSRWRRRFASSVEPVDAAGRVGFSRAVRRSQQQRGKKLPDGAWPKLREAFWHPEGGAPKASTRGWRRHVSDTFDFDDWNCSRWQRGTGGTEASQNCSCSRLGLRCDGANGRFELFAHWSLGSSQLSSDPGSSVAKSS